MKIRYKITGMDGRSAETWSQQGAEKAIWQTQDRCGLGTRYALSAILDDIECVTIHGQALEVISQFRHIHPAITEIS